MNNLQRDAILVELVDQFRKFGSWCGETHIQKATYFLQELLGVRTNFTFTLYWYGPFSFDLRDELTQLRAQGLLALRPQEPYGPRFFPTELSSNFRAEFPKTLHKHSDRILYLAERLGGKGVAELEKLATALYVTVDKPASPPEYRAGCLRTIKPRLTPQGAAEAVSEIDSAIRDVGRSFG